MVTTNMSNKSSLRCCSLPKKWWKKRNYVRYTDASKTISEFRSGNTNTGDTSPLLQHSFLSAPDGRVLVCVGCGSSFNKPYHWVVSCSKLDELRSSLTVDNKSLTEIFTSFGTISDVDKLKMFLETSNDNMNTIIEKSSCLDQLREKYLAMLLPTGL